MSEITPIPEIPPEIIQEVNSEKFAIFIGAGVSRIAGCDGWNELARNLVKKCYSPDNDDSANLFNYKLSENLLNERDHRKTITICKSLLENAKREDDFYQEVEKSLHYGEKLKNTKIYDYIYDMRGLNITTNQDDIFDKKFLESNIKYSPTQFKVDGIDKRHFYHIHGSIKHKHSMVFTLPDYFKIYSDKDVKNFLNEIFNGYTVLFVGYELNEFEILEFVIGKNVNNNSAIKHYMLKAIFFGEDKWLESERTYYGLMGIDIIPYSKDDIGYHQLSEVLKDWSKKINQSSSFVSKAMLNIKSAVEKVDHA